jgi:hypothetical protein
METFVFSKMFTFSLVFSGKVHQRAGLRVLAEKNQICLLGYAYVCLLYDDVIIHDVALQDTYFRSRKGLPKIKITTRHL